MIKTSGWTFPVLMDANQNAPTKHIPAKTNPTNKVIVWKEHLQPVFILIVITVCAVITNRRAVIARIMNSVRAMGQRQK